MTRQDTGYGQGNAYHGEGVHHRLADLRLEPFGFLLVGGYAVQHRLEGAGAFSRIHQAAEQRVELRGMPAQGGCEGLPGRHIVSDSPYQVGHLPLFGTAGHDVEGLHQGDSGAQHRGHLPREERDIG